MAAPAISRNVRTDIAYVAPVRDVQALSISPDGDGVQVRPSHSEVSGVFRLSEELNIGARQPLIVEHLQRVFVGFECDLNPGGLYRGCVAGLLNEFPSQGGRCLRECARGKSEDCEEPEGHYFILTGAGACPAPGLGEAEVISGSR